MAEIKWSKSQKDAIFSKYRKNGESSNILVSAAAGSGKTAVLVQRIIEKLVPGDLSKCIDANKLLVVTFTKAAAHEMSERIKKSLDDNLVRARKDGDILRQKAIKNQQLLLPESDITTIDAFCVRLIRRYFNILDIAPDFSIADDVQAELLADEALDELFSELYSQRNEEFTDLLCKYASNRGDDGLRDLIKLIYGFITKIPDPLLWLRKNTDALLLKDGIEAAPWYKKGKETAASDLRYALDQTIDALKYIFGTDDVDGMISENPLQKGNAIFDEWAHYYKLFYIYYTELMPICGADTKKQTAFLKSFSLPRFAKSPNVSEEDREFLKSYNNRINAAVSRAKAFLTLDADKFIKLSREKLYPTANALYNITARFSAMFYEKKLSKNVLQFNDIEQLAYLLLSQNPDVVSEIRAQYEEVLMDEYQDTSLLQEAIFSFVANGSNLFTVGDMKQSIYRFRSSDPTIFKSRLDRSSFDADSPDRKIILSQNFRSRAEVLDGINDIFAAIMSEEAGEIDYDEDQRLYCGNLGYSDTGADFKSECVLIDSETEEDDEDENPSETTLEARFIASEIARLKDSHFQVNDKGTLRDIQNRDIVILMSSHKAAADIFTAELNAYGIECFVEQQGYFARNEIRLMLALFKVINNPFSDIPLVGVLRSPIGTFTDNELAAVRTYKKGRFFSALKELVRQKRNGTIKNKADIETSEKAERFCENLERWRNYARYMPSDRLVWTLYEETDFYAFCGSLYCGDEAQANLRLLFERAKQYEAYGFRGLFGFIKYIDRIIKNQHDLTAAKLIGENNDVVRIMTIHKSKGLEFPVVFIARGGVKFEKKLESTKFIMHTEYGITLDHIDFENKRTVISPLKELFRKVSYMEQISERIRVLYVAMTRAREKLYFVSSAPKASPPVLTDGRLSPEYVISAMNFRDLVLPVAAASDNWNLKTVSYSSLRPVLRTAETKSVNNDLESPDIARLLEFKYPYPDTASVASKVSVSDLKSQKTTELIPKPAFLSGKTRSGASYGTLIHTVLQHLVPKKNMDSEYIMQTVSELAMRGIIEESDTGIVNPRKILDFYRSDIGMRIIESDKVFREQPFELLVPLELAYPDLTGAEDEKIILQGIIDCWFTEGDEIVLVDYKTDSFSDIDEIHQKYDRQLELYSYALNKMTGKNIKSKNIYLFSSGNVIQC